MKAHPEWALHERVLLDGLSLDASFGRHVRPGSNVFAAIVLEDRAEAHAEHESGLFVSAPQSRQGWRRHSQDRGTRIALAPNGAEGPNGR